MEYSVTLLLITLVCSAITSGLEIAFISSNKLMIELDSKQGKLSARILAGFVRRPSRFIGTMLLANNTFLVIYGIVMAALLEPVIISILPEPYNAAGTVMVIQTILSTIIILFTAEFLPKAIFRAHPNRILGLFAVPLWLLYHLLLPFVLVITGFTEWLLKRVFGVKADVRQPSFARVDLDHYIREITQHGSQESEIQNEMQIFRKALDFNKVKVRECMVPRNEMVAIEASKPVEELRNKFAETGLSRILVYRDNIDQVIGFVHVHELFRHPESISSILLPVSIVPETMPARDLLTMFTQLHRTVAVVVDEFGSTSGMATMEDVIEEIFGEIEDEYDIESLVEKKLNDREFVFSGKLEVDYLNGKYRFGIPVHPEYKTLAGFIIHYYESIPVQNEEVIIPPFVFVIQKASRTGVDQVKMILRGEGD